MNVILYVMGWWHISLINVIEQSILAV